MRIAIVGAGIAGLGAAWLLQRQGHAVTLFEADARLGGHTATVDVTLDGKTFPVDTGFLVFNDRTYPKLIALFDELGVTSVASEMSFSCRIDRASAGMGRHQPRGRCSRSPATRCVRRSGACSPTSRASTGAPCRCKTAPARGRSRSANTSTRRTIRRHSATGTCCRWRPRSGRRPGATSSTFRCRRSCASAQPRPAADRRPSAMAHRAGRRARLRGKNRGAIARRARRHAGAADSAHAPRRCDRHRTARRRGVRCRS